MSRLFEDFSGKCYICEIKPVDDPEVEHLLPHKNGAYPDRMYDWHNLFYACRHCNGVKNKPKYDVGILDCCACDPEEYLDQELVENAVHVGVRDADDATANVTAELIEEVFTSDNPSLRKRAAQVRLTKLQLRMNALYGMLREYTENGGEFEYRALSAMLRRDAPFAGFTRCYVRKHLPSYPELGDLLV